MRLPFVKGVVVGADWKELGPEGEFDWGAAGSPNQRLLKTPGKFIRLRRRVGDRAVPEWAIANARTVEKIRKPKPDKIKEEAKPPKVKPAKWDENYLAAWWDFVRQMGKRYAGNPRLIIVVVTGPTGPCHEMGMPSGMAELWKRKG